MEMRLNPETGVYHYTSDRGFKVDLVSEGAMDASSIMKEKEIKKLKSQLTWKTIEIDGIPEKGIYLCKTAKLFERWVYTIAEIKDGGFIGQNKQLPIKPNYYRLIWE